jgi:hypothetical protein
MKATDFYAALAGHASGRFSEGFSLRRSHGAALTGLAEPLAPCLGEQQPQVLDLEPGA